MNTKRILFKLICRPITIWAARRALVGRNRSRREPEKGRFTPEEVSRVLDGSWHTFDGLAPDVSREPTLGSRLNVQLAALTLAFFHSLTEAGIQPDYAIELVADAGWQIYQYWGQLGRLTASLFPRNAAKRVRPGGLWPIAFPFNSPGYIARYVPTEKGIGFDMLRCPVAEYFRLQGTGEVAVGTWCSLDYAIAEMGGYGLRRTRTLAAGDDRCDFRWWPATGPKTVAGAATQGEHPG